MNIYDRNKNDSSAELADKVQESNLNDYLEDISIVEPGYEWLSTSEARWLTRQDEVINFW
tara:strand:- start:491 stop:670 length:180 start_codon:yes stop_codon:yes gene_type:complete